METTYSMHGHTRSLSSLASSILPFPSDASTFTSVTASPMDPHDPDRGSMEFESQSHISKSMSENHLNAKSVAQQDTQKPEMDICCTEENEDHNPHRKIPSDTEIRAYDSFTKLSEPWPPPPRSLPLGLDELAQLVIESRYQSRRALTASLLAKNLALAQGLNKRLSKTLWIAYGNLIDQYKIDDQAGFGGLYEASDRLTSLCHQAQNRSSRDANQEEPKSEKTSIQAYGTPWIQNMRTDEKESVLAFLTKIRTEEGYLAERFCSLTPTQLTALTASYHPAGIDLSILANHSYGATSVYSQDSQMMKLSRRMDNIQRFHVQDPFFILMYSIFDISAEAGSYEYSRRNAVWSSACASVIQNSKTRSDEFIIAATDAFRGFEDWKMKSQLEAYLMDLLDKGSFLLESPAATPLETDRSQSENAEHAAQEAGFFDNALKDLFSLLASDLKNHFLPRPVLDFIRSTLQKIADRGLQLKAKIFFVTRWYFASLLSSILVYPELHGLAMTHHISHAARRKILNEVVVRMQVQVFDVLDSREGEPIITPRNRNEIIAICDCFEPLHFSRSWKIPGSTRELSSDQDVPDFQVILSSQDVLGLIQSLHPQDPIQEAVNGDSSSPPPSTTSSSTLRPDPSDVGSSSTSTEVSPYESPTLGDEVAAVEGRSDPPIDANESRPDISSIMNGSEHQAVRAPALDETMLWRLQRRLQSMLKDAVRAQADPVPDDWSLFRSSPDGMLSSDLNFPPNGANVDSARPLFNPIAGSGEPRSDFDALKTAIFTLLTVYGNGQLGSQHVDHEFSHHSSKDLLEPLFESAIIGAQMDFDSKAAHYWWNALSLYRQHKGCRVENDVLCDLFSELSQDTRDSIISCKQSAIDAENMVRSFTNMAKHQRTQLRETQNQRKALRIKMWYVSDVRHSSIFEEAELVTQALHNMGPSKRKRTFTGVSDWARHHPRGPMSQDRAVKQTTDALAVSQEFGIRKKLADEQVDMTCRWMDRNNVENFCKGEERIHRFCYQIQKSVDRLAAPSLLESPELWSSNLFRREKSFFDTRAPRNSAMIPTGELTRSPSQLSLSNSGLPLSIHSPPNSYPIPSFPQQSYAIEPHNPFSTLRQATRSNLFDISLQPRPSPAFIDVNRQNGPISIASNQRGPMRPMKSQSEAKDDFITQLKQALFALLLSDLCYTWGFCESETDNWVNGLINTELPAVDQRNTVQENPDGAMQNENTAEDGHLNLSASTLVHLGALDSHRLSRNQDTLDLASNAAGSEFPYRRFYKLLLHRMSMTYDPRLKFQLLCEFGDLVEQDSRDSLISQFRRGNGFVGPAADNHTVYSGSNSSFPSHTSCSLSDVMNKCAQRRSSTLRLHRQPNGLRICTNADLLQANQNGPFDVITQKMLSIFRDPQIRPLTVFRDLQLIAAFIPSSTLDHNASAKAFWDASIAAMALKDELCATTVRRATEITNNHISKIPLPPLYPSMKDAANLWLVAAKEGSLVAARELGLFYLTHPDLIPRAVLPLSKTRETFKSMRSTDQSSAYPQAFESRERGALDPLTFAVVFHWMEIAANGGDQEADAFLKQGESG